MGLSAPETLPWVTRHDPRTIKGPTLGPVTSVAQTQAVPPAALTKELFENCVLKSHMPVEWDALLQKMQNPVKKDNTGDDVRF